MMTVAGQLNHIAGRPKWDSLEKGCGRKRLFRKLGCGLASGHANRLSSVDGQLGSRRSGFFG